MSLFISRKAFIVVAGGNELFSKITSKLARPEDN